MAYITVGKENGANIDIYYKDWAKVSPSCSATQGVVNLVLMLQTWQRRRKHEASADHPDRGKPSCLPLLELPAALEVLLLARF